MLLREKMSREIAAPQAGTHDELRLPAAGGPAVRGDDSQRAEA